MEITRPGEVEKVINGGFCIGCGACAFASRHYEVGLNDFGALEARQSDPLAREVGFALDDICPFSAVENESSLADEIFSTALNFDERVGKFEDIYIGSVSNEKHRTSSSSGGLISWLLCEMLNEGAIDGVVHVRPSDSVEGISTAYQYAISSTPEEIRLGAGSKYYPVSFEGVLKDVLRSPLKRFVFVGVPCTVKAVRLLCRSDSALAERIAFCFAIFCGHMKSVQFAEMIGWQLGISPSALATVEFRVKRKERPANDYAASAKAIDSLNSDLVNSSAPVSHLYGMDWGLGYFKPKACDWCDDVAGELADFSSGDAWLPGIQDDWRGTSIAIVRNPAINALLESGRASGALVARKSSPEEVYASQSGNYRHRWDGLLARSRLAKERGDWTPQKRGLGTYPTKSREVIYDLREQLSKKSHTTFAAAKRKKSFTYFVLAMSGIEMRYALKNGRALRYCAKTVLNLARYYTRLSRRSLKRFISSDKS